MAEKSKGSPTTVLQILRDQIEQTEVEMVTLTITLGWGTDHRREIYRALHDMQETLDRLMRTVASVEFAPEDDKGTSDGPQS